MPILVWDRCFYHSILPRTFHADLAAANWATSELCGSYRQLRNLSRQVVVAIRNCADGEARLLLGHYVDRLSVLGRPVRLRLILRHGHDSDISALNIVWDRPFSRCLSGLRCHELVFYEFL